MRFVPAVIALALVAGAAVAAPTVIIRAHTDASLRPVRRLPDGTLAIAGTIVERASGVGVGGIEVTIDVAGVSQTATTRQDGSFEINAAPSDVPVDVEVTFAGDDRFDPAGHTEHRMDPSKAPVDLTLEVTTTPTGAIITADARADGVRVELPVQLRFSGDQPEPHLDVPATSGKPLTMSRAELFGPGPKRVRATYAGDASYGGGAYGPAHAETTFELATATTTTLSVGSGNIAFEGTIAARGKVLDEDQAPVPDAAVVLLAGDRRLGATTTGADGAWRINAAADLLGTGKHTLQAAAETTARWLRPSRSGPATVTVGTPRPAPVGITLAAFAVTALIAVGFVVGRKRPWRKAEPAAAPSPAQAEIRGGLEPARPSLVSTLRRAHDHGFAGSVRDAVRGRVLPGAEVLLSLGSDVRHTVATDDGRFAIEELTAGEWTARVASPGHVSEHFTVTIPHRGELRGARIDLVPVREKIFTLYRRAALPILPSPDLWGIWSPRQIVDHVRAATPPARLTDLTAFVEECYFSARVPDETVLPAAEAKVAAALAERAGPPGV